MHRLSGVVEVFKVIAIVFLSALILRSFVFQPYVVEGSSMETNFHNGEYLFVAKLPYHIHQPKRGDVIVFHYPRDPRLAYIKRIIGLPGEEVSIKSGKVYVNGELLPEEYLPSTQETVVDSNKELNYDVTLGSSQFFVMGDNRDHSSDSREWGPLDKSFIIGKAALVLYPHSSFHAIASPSYR